MIIGMLIFPDMTQLDFTGPHEVFTRLPNPVRRDVTVFNSVHLRFHVAGVTQAQGADLIERFKGR